MNEAIKLAIEAGYKYSDLDIAITTSQVFTLKDGVIIDENPSSQFLLDPLFWQALGKALGWKKKMVHAEDEYGPADYQDGWLYHWHRFIDWIAEQQTVNPKYRKSIDEFFKNLLK